MKANLVLLICLLLSWHLLAEESTSAANPETRARAQQLLDLSYEQNLHSHERAVQTAQQALSIFQSLNDQQGVGDVYFALGDYYFALNKMNEAAQSYASSLQIWRELHHPVKEATMLTHLGFIEGRKGEWLNGFSYLTQAQNLIDDQKDAAQMGQITAGMAYFFNESGSPENGLIQYERARDYYHRDPTEERSHHRQVMLVGYTYLLLKNYDAALSQLQQALQLFESSRDSKADFDSADCELYIGQVYLATGKYDLALQHLLPISTFFESKGNESDAAEVDGLIGKAYQELGKISLARTKYQAALKNFRETNDPIRKAPVAFALGELELNQGNYDDAENYLSESIATAEDIRSDLKSRTLATTFSATVQDRYETYIDCLMQKHKHQPSATGLVESAFEASERVRARSLEAFLHDTQTRIVTGLEPELAEKERSLRQAIRTQWEQTISLLANNSAKKQLDESESVLTNLREQHQQLIRQIEKQHPHYNQFKESPTYSIQQIQQQIVEDDHTMLLEYFLGKNASYVWAVTRNDVRVYELPPSEVITGAVKAVYELLEKKPNDDTEKHLDDAGGKLAQMILTPLVNQSGINRLIVVADSALNYIPFQLLPVAPDDRTPLVAKYEIINAPSASVLGQLRQEIQQRPATTRILAAFGDPAFQSNYAQLKAATAGESVAKAKPVERGLEVDFDSPDPAKIQPLVYSGIELDHLSEIAGNGAFVARGFDASRAMLEKTDFSKYAILHLATHGFFNPEKSGLALAMKSEADQDLDGFITMNDIYNLRVPVSLVVLSACRTGLGKDVRGEGLIGLTRGFMHAGASSVVASMWKVDDEATSELMKNFYINMLKKDMTPAAALREAQNTLRQDPQWQSPHYWAGFTLQGEFKERIKLPAPTTAPRVVQNAVGLGLLLTLLTGLAWGFRRRRSQYRPR